MDLTLGGVRSRPTTEEEEEMVGRANDLIKN